MCSDAQMSMQLVVVSMVTEGLFPSLQLADAAVGMLCQFFAEAATAIRADVHVN